MNRHRVGRLVTAVTLAFAPALLLADLAHANIAVCDTHQVNGGDEAFLMNLNTPLEFGGTVYDGNIFVSPKGTVTFGKGDFTFWDFPQTPSISIGSFDYHAFASGSHPWGANNDLYVRYGSTETSVCVDWKVLPWGQSSGDPIYIRMIAEVNPENYTWTPSYQVSSNAPEGARYGLRYTQGGEVVPLNIQTITSPPEPAPEVPPAPEPTPEPETESPESESPTASPETESPTVSPETESATVSPETESPTASPETESPTVSPETESPSVSEEATESPTVSEDISESPSTSPQYPGLPAIWDYSVNEGWTLDATAPEGKIFASAVARYESQTSECGIDVSEIVLSVFAGTSSASISATNDVFTDPCPGEYKKLIVAFGYADIESSSPDISESPSVSPEPVPAPEPEPSPSPAPAPQPVAPAPVAPGPEPQPTTPEPAEPEPQPEPTPEETIEPEPTPGPTPSPTADPKPVEPAPVPSETPKPIVQETRPPTPTPSPTPVETVKPSPTPTPSQTSPAPSPSPTPTETPKPIEEEKPIVIIPVDPTLVVESLLNVDLETQRIAPEQIAEIRNAVEQVFDEVEKGSEQYEEALEALAVIAEADDAELPEELAAIPVLGAVAGEVLNVFNDLGNIGADMAPEQRERAEETVIAAVIVGQVAQVAAAVSISVGRVK